MAVTDPSLPQPLPPLVVVDDERSFTDLLGGILSEILTCPVLTFTRSAEAASYFEAQPIGLLVTDYYMPPPNGLELIRRLQQARPGVPAIIITGHTLDRESAAMRELTAVQAILPKPFSWRRLADEIIARWPGPAKPALRS